MCKDKSSGDKSSLYISTDTVFLRANTEVKRLSKGCQWCFLLLCSHLQMPLKEICEWLVLSLPIWLWIVIPKVNIPNAGLPICAFFHLCWEEQWQCCHHHAGQSLPKLHSEVDQVAAVRISLWLMTSCKTWNSFPSDPRPGVYGGGRNVFAGLFCSILRKLIFLNMVLVGIWHFFYEVSKYGSSFGHKIVPLHGLFHVCRMSEEGKVQTCHALSWKQLVFAIPPLTSPPPDSPQLVFTSGILRFKTIFLYHIFKRHSTLWSYTRKR